MTESILNAGECHGGPRRVRYLIDLVVLVVVSIFLPIGCAAIYEPATMQSDFVFAGIIQLFLIAIAWLLVRLRGERIADIGLKSPKNWARTVLFGLLTAALVFGAMYLMEKAGIRRDLSRFKAVQGNTELAVYGVLYAFIGAGFYEEFMFRGFLFQGMAMLFGGSQSAWIGACLVQGALFGASHAYQSPIGMLITGVLGAVMGGLVLASGRNLWLVIIGHGLYDASRFVLFYFQGPPLG